MKNNDVSRTVVQGSLRGAPPGRRRVVGRVAGLTVAALVATALVAPAAGAVESAAPAAAPAAVAPDAPVAAAATPADSTVPVTADPLPTTQIDGIVWAQTIVGGRAYAGGQFTSARPAGAAAGTGETPRANILRYDVETGVLDASWNPGTNGRVLAISSSPDGKRLYVAGAFTEIAGQTRYRLAAFDTATGALVSSWNPGTNSTVYDIKATNSTVYITGEFSNVNNTARARIAALDASTGALLGFAPELAGGYGGRAIEISPDGAKVVVAGSFTSTNGSTNPGRGMAALDATTGTVLPWAVNSVIRNGGDNAAIYSLASDGDSVYGSGYDYGGSKTEDDFEGSFRASWSDGSLVWMEDCHGDTYSVYPAGDSVYVATHAHYCGNIGEFPQTDPWTVNHSLAFAKEPSDRKITPDIWGYRSFTGQTAGKLLHWYPTWSTGSASGISQAGWDITANDKYVVYGGEFTRVAGARQQGLVRFARRDVAPTKIGPTIQGGQYVISTRSLVSGSARVSWPANIDQDNAELTYELYRRGTTAPISTQKASSTYWVRPTMGYTDSGLAPGSTVEYRVKVIDGDGNSTVSNWTPVTIAAQGSSTAYNDSVLGDSPVSYWPMNEASGSSATDWASLSDLALTNGTTRGVDGKDVPPTAKATRFSGANGVSGSTPTATTGPQRFSVEAWFRTTSTSGGKIVGFGNAKTGTSSSYDRHIYMNNSGRLTFGVHPGMVREITTAGSYNDGAWHHVVGTLDGSGMTFWVDGVKAGQRSDTTSAQSYSGYWRVGGDSQSGWPNSGSSNFFNGTISDVAVYDRALTRGEVSDHWTASGRPAAGATAPQDAYGQAVYSLEPTLYWRLGESSGSVAKDSGPDASDGSYSGPVTKSQTGALTGVTDTAVRFQPTKNIFGTWNGGLVASQRSYANPTVYSVETWFKTDTTTGGKLIGFGSSRTGTSSNYDRHVYMSADGKVKFGAYDGAQQVLSTTGSYRDNAWHHVVATQSSEGMRLYLDGELVGSNDKAVPENTTGYWRLGGDNGWEGDTYWKGYLDEAAVYPVALTPAQVKQHFQLGSGTTPNVPPQAVVTAQADGLTVSVDGSGSSDPDGTLTGYAWDFGDGATGTGATATHTYDAPGTYTITLDVTDDRGATATATTSVKVLAPNVKPQAAFTASATDLTVAVDGSSSSDPDGTIASYAWSFGDDATAEGATASHTYAQAGTYTVTLTVTDDRGGTSSVSHDVVATAPAEDVVARDTFDRAVTSGWGTTTSGAAWSALGGAAAFSVADSAGTLTMSPSWTREARLAGVSESRARTETTFWSDVASVGGTTSVTLIGRQVGTSTYSARVRLEPNGLMRLYLLRDETLLGNQLLPATYAPGTRYTVSISAVGTSPTTLSAKVWPTAAGPAQAWHLEATDTTAALQSPGTVSIKVAVSSASTNPTTRVSFDDVKVVREP